MASARTISASSATTFLLPSKPHPHNIATISTFLGEVSLIDAHPDTILSSSASRCGSLYRSTPDKKKCYFDSQWPFKTQLASQLFAKNKFYRGKH